MQDFTSVEKLQHATVYGADGDKIGSVGQVYLDDQTNQPTFVTVKTGLFGTKETFVPVSKATTSGDGLQVPFDKAFIKDAPTVEADGSLSPEEERRIYEYYSLDYQDTSAGTGTGTGTGTTTGRNTSTGTTTGGNTGTRTGGDTESVIARDEQLNVGTEVRETGQVRLRKHTYTDTETVQVPVTREEVVVERESIDPNSAEAQRASGDEEVVVTTREEVPVVDKTATAEKVTVDKNTVQDTQRVSGTVQREDIEVEGDNGTTGRRR
jgi:uncharacterized protein (TIGR02271 family)